MFLIVDGVSSILLFFIVPDCSLGFLDFLEAAFFVKLIHKKREFRTKAQCYLMKGVAPKPRDLILCGIIF